MSQYDVLQRIPLLYEYDENDPEYGGFDYICTKDMVMTGFRENLAHGLSLRSCVGTEFWQAQDVSMDENGMEKLTCMIAGALFQIEHGQVDPDLAHGVLWDIRDFETGNYDDLFTVQDLQLIREDIRIVKESLEQRPELLDRGLKSIADIEGDNITSAFRNWYHIKRRGKPVNVENQDLEGTEGRSGDHEPI